MSNHPMATNAVWETVLAFSALVIISGLMTAQLLIKINLTYAGIIEDTLAMTN